jgi:hypothetical protein
MFIRESDKSLHWTHAAVDRIEIPQRSSLLAY